MKRREKIKTKGIKCFTIALTFVMLFGAFNIFAPHVEATIQTKSLSVPMKKQEQTKWCWAACAEMQGKYIYNPAGNTRNQTSIVTYVKGSADNVTGNLLDSINASDYACYNRKTFYYTQAWAWSRIKTEIDANRSVGLSAGYYNSSGIRTSGHVVVCLGYTYNSSYNTYLIHYNDPWDGIKYNCEFSQFQDGSFNGRRYDGTSYYM